MTDIGDITAGVGFVINQADLMTKLKQAEQLIANKPIQIRVGLDPAYVAAQTQKLTDALTRAATNGSPLTHEENAVLDGTYVT